MFAGWTPPPIQEIRLATTFSAGLRSGSANFSMSGERAQDNDLIVVRNEGTAAKFDAHFERMWDGGQPMVEFGPAIEAMEPR